MKNFMRALKYAWPYRRRLVLSIVCALFAAGLWSLNFTAIYPILKVFGTGDNLQSWVDKSIDLLGAEIKPLEETMAELKKRKADVDKIPDENQKKTAIRQLEGRKAGIESKLKLLQDELYRFHVAKKYLDKYCPTDRYQTLVLVLCIVVGAVVIRGFFEFFQESFVGSVVNHSLFDLRDRLFRKVLHLDVAHFSEAGTHDLTTRLTQDIDALGGGMRTIFGKVIAEPLKALACISVAAWINWQLTLMCLILVPFALLVLTRVGRTMKRATRRLLEGMGSIYKILQETFLGIRIIKAFAREPRERRRFRKVTRDYFQKAMWVINLDALTSPIIEVMTVIAVAFVFLAGAYIVLEKPTHILGIPISDTSLEAETLLQLYALLAAAADPIRRLSNVYTRIQSGWAAADRIFGYIDKEPKILQNVDAPVLERHHRDIEFRNVCFSYVPGQVLLEGVDLRIKHGEVIAIVGKNGCGKTSLLNLLPRFYDPDHGSLFIDGHDIRAINLRSLRKQIAVVTQDSFLFDDTVLSNIAYAKPSASRAEIETAAMKAQAHDFIMSDLGQGYETIVGTGGGKLSGGQRQRICLARAFLADPSILILDEFTNQNDPEAELDVHRALQDFRKGRTIFLITHRLHTLEIANRIVVLDEGRVAACGTHAELLRTCSVYQRLHDVQQQRLVA